MTARRSFLMLVASGLTALTLSGAALADPADVQVGALRTPLNRGGVALKSEPKMTAAVLGNIEHGTRLRALEVKGVWMRVNAKIADGAETSGWVRSADTVEPYALTGGGSVGTSTGPRGAAQASAAGRGFSPSIEEQLALSDGALRAGYALLDSVVEAVKPSPEQVATFAKEGRLGIPGQTR